MRHAGDQLPGRRETALLLGTAAQHSCHLIEMRSQLADLVLAPHLHPGVEVALGHCVQPAAEVGQRALDPPPHDGHRYQQQRKAQCAPCQHDRHRALNFVAQPRLEVRQFGEAAPLGLKHDLGHLCVQRVECSQPPECGRRLIGLDERHQLGQARFDVGRQPLGLRQRSPEVAGNVREEGGGGGPDGGDKAAERIEGGLAPINNCSTRGGGYVIERNGALGKCVEKHHQRRCFAAQNLGLGRHPDREVQGERDKVEDDQADRPDHHPPQALRPSPHFTQGTATGRPSTMRVITIRDCRAAPNSRLPVTPW